MTPRRYELSDFEWSIIDPLLPIQNLTMVTCEWSTRLRSVCMGRSRGGLTTKIQALVDAKAVVPDWLSVTPPHNL
jgi:hypothetical protein